MTEEMRAAVFHQTGGPDVLGIETREVPTPGPGEVLIKVTSAGLNRADVLFRQGRYYVEPRFPSRIGKEAAGVVAAAGEGVTYAVGERVATLPVGVDESTQGALAEYVLAPVSKVVPTPVSVGDDDAAGIWMQYLTAWGALSELVGLHAGQTLVVSAASSSVGLAAIQIGRMLGAEVIATTTSPGKVERLQAEGADHVIAVTRENYVERINDITRRGGVDAIFDPVAGPGVHDHVKVCKPDGWLVLYGVLDQAPVRLNPGLLIGKNVTLRGYTVYALLQDPDATGRAVAGVRAGLDGGKLHLVVDSRFTLDAVRDAFLRMESNEQFGKILVNP